MNDARIPTFLFLPLVAFAVLQCLHIYPQLPDVMASHFDAHGTPNGWQPKSAFFILISVPKIRSTCPTNRIGLLPNAAKKPGAFSVCRWPGGVALFSLFCFTPCSRRSTQTYPALPVSIRKECGTRWPLFCSSPSFGWFIRSAISPSCQNRILLRFLVAEKIYALQLTHIHRGINVGSSRST
jgi:Protein of unknown function (DUF1648)